MTVTRHPNNQGVTLSQWRYNATGGETTLSGTDAFGAGLSYTVGAEQVFVNGVLLERGVDYTASTGTTVTGLTALVAGDIVTVSSPSAFNVANAIPKATVAAKGDLIVGNGASSVTNLAVGADGTTLVANSSAGAGVSWTSQFLAGKNKIINGDFGIWQRGTSFSNPNGVYTADRWYCGYDGSGSTRTISQQTFTAGTAPVAGYEGTYFLRIATTVAGSGQTYANLYQPIEDVRAFAGQTITLSFWAKADSSRTLTPTYGQSFGTGGSSAVYGSFSALNLTTSWQRFSTTVTLPSISGKTIGTNSQLQINLTFPLNAVSTIDFWGVQVEAGSVATPFTTATGTLQGELAACQRYYYRQSLANNTGVYMTYLGNATMSATLYFPTIMRVTPSATCNINSYTTSNSPTATQVYLNAYYVGNLSGTWSSGATTIGAGSPNFGYINLYGWTSPTTGLLYSLGGGTSCYADWSAEL